MLTSIDLANYHIKIHPRESASNISQQDWDDLSRSSIFTNPFYERWNLLPALNHLEKELKVFVITIHKNAVLIGLFPIHIGIFKYTIKYLTLWQHDHCYLSDPLLKEAIDLNFLLCQIGQRLNTQFTIISLHSADLFISSRNIHSVSTTRAAVLNKNHIIAHLEALSGKFKREIKRTKRKIINEGNLNLIQQDNLQEGLNNYCELEHQGWKGRDGGSIDYKHTTRSYYQDIIKSQNLHQAIQIQELRLDDQCIAACIRFKSNQIYYEVKTTYNEAYKKLAPGKLLEIEILKDLTDSNFRYIDSCTQQNNRLINTLWPDKIELKTSYFFYPNFYSYTLSVLHKIKFIFLRIKDKS